MKKLWFICLSTALLGLLFASCSKDAAAPQNELTEIEGIIADENHEYFFDLAIDDRDEANMFDGFSSFGGTGKVAAPLDSVVRFGRKIDSSGVRRAVIDAISDDTVKVGLARHFSGQFVIFNKLEDTTGTRPVVIHRKRLQHTIRRNAIFVRTDRSITAASDRPRWQLKAVSFGAGQSRPETTIQMKEVQIVGERGDSLVITNPLRQYLNVERIPTFEPGEEVTVTVRLMNNTANPVDIEGNGSTETLLLHYGANRDHHARKRFHYRGVDPVTGDQVYVGQWRVHQQRFRVYHAVIDAIDNGTIYDSDASTYPYNSVTWGSPYRVGNRD